jgi:hypothetical protein
MQSGVDFVKAVVLSFHCKQCEVRQLAPLAQLIEAVIKEEFAVEPEKQTNGK